ncbi:hypothetical protein Tco_0751503 [Tanacetum coccineum]|uniref:Uncharacterized protein n=1 Tax=Tanacetum coccineum TaxID=301880 RepID=A0ABQ4Z523_9ASTR
MWEVSRKVALMSSEVRKREGHVASFMTLDKVKMLLSKRYKTSRRGVDGPPIMTEDPYAYIMAAYQVPPSPDYIPGLEEPQSPPILDFVPEPMYLEYMSQEDEILLAEEQPLPAAASPIDDEDPEEDPADYPADRDDDDDEVEEEEPSRDDANDEDEDEDEEEEHPALADSDPHVHRMTARISIRDEPSISLPPREEVERLLALTTPPPSPLTPLSSPLPQIPSPPLPASPPTSVLPASPPASSIRPLGYRAAMIQLRVEIPSTSHPLPLPTLSPPLQLLSSDHRTDMPEITLTPRKRLGIDLGPRYEIGESSATAATRPIGGRRADYRFVGTMDTEIKQQRAKEVGYGIRDVWVDPREAVEEVAPMTLEGVNTRVTELTAVQEQDTQDIYVVIGDTQDRQTQIYQSVETLVGDSQYHYETARLLDQEALVSREAWGCSIEVSYMTRSEIMALRSVVMGQQVVISQLQVADRKSQAMTSEMLQADHRRQAEIAALHTFDSTRQEQLVQTLTLM